MVVAGARGRGLGGAALGDIMFPGSWAAHPYQNLDLTMATGPASAVTTFNPIND